MRIAVALAFFVTSPALAGQTLVVCAPGYPGTTIEAQPAMDEFAARLAEAGGLATGELGAVYFEQELPGLARLQKEDAALALVPLAFFLQHGNELGLHAKLQAVQRGGAALEAWTLVARKGTRSLDGFTVASIAGFSPRFVHAMVKLPPGVSIVHSAAVLSSLRKAAAGEPIAVLLDATEEAATATLPFAGELETLATSRKVPAAIVATVGGHLRPDRWGAFARAFAKLPESAAGAEAMAAVRMERFVPLDGAALASAREAFAGAAQ